MEDLRGKVSPALAKQRAGVDDPGVGHGFDRRSNVLATALAGDDKVTDAGSGFMKHGAILGESKANKLEVNFVAQESVQIRFRTYRVPMSALLPD